MNNWEPVVADLSENEFLHLHSIELKKYAGHPLLQFLRNLKHSDSKAFYKLLWYLGEIDSFERTHPCKSWFGAISHAAKFAFNLACPEVAITRV